MTEPCPVASCVSSADDRRSVRANVLLAATISAPGLQIRIRVSNLSAHGALVVADNIPREGAEVTFGCNGLSIRSYVAWVRGQEAGIEFAEPLQPELLLKTIVIRQMITKDRRGIDFRRPGFRGSH